MWPPELLAVSKTLPEYADESQWFALWNAILNLSFPFEEGYFVSPVVDMDEGPDWERFELVRRAYIVQRLTIDNGEFKRCNIFFVEVKAAGENARSIGARKDADYLMRCRYNSVLNFPAILHAVSAFGTRICHYKMERETRRLSPRRTEEDDPNRIVDNCPASWWELDVLTQAGYDAFMKVVAEAKEQGRRELENPGR